MNQLLTKKLKTPLLSLSTRSKNFIYYVNGTIRFDVSSKGWG
jgi:hypothetical protein